MHLCCSIIRVCVFKCKCVPYTDGCKIVNLENLYSRLKICICVGCWLIRVCVFLVFKYKCVMTFALTKALDFGKTGFVFQNLHLCFSTIRVCVFKTQMCDSLSLTLTYIVRLSVKADLFFKTCIFVSPKYVFAFSKRKCVILFHVHWSYKALDFGKTGFFFQNVYLCFSIIRFCVFKTQMCDSLSRTLILHR